MRFQSALGFSIAEVIVAVAVLSLMFGAFFAGLSLSLSVVQSARETLRATQIMTEQLDKLRVMSWDDIKSLDKTNYYPTFNPVSSNVPSSGGKGLIYTAQVYAAKATLSGEDYEGDDIRKVRVLLTWKSGKMIRQAEMSTFASRYGMSNYNP